MRLLFIAPLPPPIHGQSIASKVFLDAIKQCNTVEVVNTNKKSQQDGINSFGRIFEVISILTSIARKQRASDIIYFQISESFSGNLKDLIFYALCYKKLPNTFVHLHGGSIKEQLWDKYKWLNSINSYFLRKVGGVIISGMSHRKIFDNILGEEKIRICNNFSSDDMFIELNDIDDKYRENKVLKVLYLSNFHVEKGFEYLLEACVSSKTFDKSNLQVDFAGKFEDPIKEQIFIEKTKTVDFINYHGFVNSEQKRRLFRKAHIFCLPTSYFEGQPISILEAYASGCVVLTTGQPGILDVFTPQINGFQIETKSSMSIKKELDALVNNIDELRLIGINNWRTAKAQFTIRQHCERLREILQLN